MTEIKLAKTAGFCFGVDRAVNLVYDLVEKGREFLLSVIIHNQQLVDDLAEKGVQTIEHPCDCKDGYKIIIRTHGVEKSIVEDIEKGKFHS